VTAGLYLLIRSSPILEYSSTALLVITLIGSTTAFVGATSGLVQNDLKRIIAMSTVSQLGYSLLVLIIILNYFSFFEFYNIFSNVSLSVLTIISIKNKLNINNKFFHNDISNMNNKDNLNTSINFLD
jgi:NADH:ubiquinone oxidoreductase subunit 5 (subunit L)/multisubunit Na+/H+ antiporter MnhA subunit